jgi:hypothetical protein
LIHIALPRLPDETTRAAGCYSSRTRQKREDIGRGAFTAQATPTKTGMINS